MIYKAIYLARTALALSAQGGKFSIPTDDGPLLEQVYGAIGAANLEEQLDQWEKKQLGEDAANRFLADGVRLEVPRDIWLDMRAIANWREPDEWTPTTRLGGDSQNFVLLNGDAAHETLQAALQEKWIEQAVQVSHQGLVRALENSSTPKD